MAYSKPVVTIDLEEYQVLTRERVDDSTLEKMLRSLIVALLNSQKRGMLRYAAGTGLIQELSECFRIHGYRFHIIVNEVRVSYTNDDIILEKINYSSAGTGK